MKREEYLQRLKTEFESYPDEYSSYWKVRSLLDFIEASGFLPPAIKRIHLVKSQEEAMHLTTMYSNHAWSK